MSSIEYNRVYTATVADHTAIQYVPIEQAIGDVGDAYMIKNLTLYSNNNAFGTQAEIYNFKIYTSDDAAGTNAKLLYSQPLAYTPALAVFNPFSATTGTPFISKQPYLGFEFNFANATEYKMSLIYSKIESTNDLSNLFLVKTGVLDRNSLSAMLSQLTQTCIVQSIAFTNVNDSNVYAFKTFIGANNSAPNTAGVANMTGINLMPAQSVVVPGSFYMSGSTTSTTNILQGYVSGSVAPPAEPISYYISYTLAGD